MLGYFHEVWRLNYVLLRDFNKMISGHYRLAANIFHADAYDFLIIFATMMHPNKGDCTLKNEFMTNFFFS